MIVVGLYLWLALAAILLLGGLVAWLIVKWRKGVKR